MEKGWTQIYSTVNDYQATMAKDLLEEAGITVVILNQHDSTYLSFGEYLVFVPDNEEKRALEMINDLKN